MENKLASFTLSKLAKEKGFKGRAFDSDGESISYDIRTKRLQSYLYFDSYKDMLATGTLSDLHEWLREKHNLIIMIGLTENGYSSQVYEIAIQEECERIDLDSCHVESTYREAFEAVLISTFKSLNV